MKDMTFIQCINLVFQDWKCTKHDNSTKKEDSPKSRIFKFSLTKSQLPFIIFTGCKYKENTEEHTATGFWGTDGDW